MKTLSLAALLCAAASPLFAEECTQKSLKAADLPPGVTVAGGTFNERGSIVTTARRSAILREACARRSAQADSGAGDSRSRHEARAEGQRLLTDMMAARHGLELSKPQAASRIEPLLERWRSQEASLPTLPRELAEALRNEHGRMLATYGAGRVQAWQDKQPPSELDSAILSSLPESSDDPRVLTRQRFLDAAEAEHKLNLRRVAANEEASKRAMAGVRAPGETVADSPATTVNGSGNDTCDAVRDARGLGSDSVARKRCEAMGAYK